LNTI